MRKADEIAGSGRDGEAASPALSVIMPCYKAERHIGAMLGDIMRQTFTDWELIAVSNGEGQEAQLEILRRFEAERPQGKIRTLAVKRGNVSDARNLGLDQARGRWIAFVDADDRADPNHFELLMEKTSGGDVDIVVGGFKVCGHSGRLTSLEKIDNRQTYISLRRLLESRSPFMMGGLWNKVYRAEFLRGCGARFNPEETCRQDATFNLAILGQTDKIRSVAMSGYRYLWHNSLNASARYHACFGDTTARYNELRENLMLRAGFTQDEIARERLRAAYHGLYLTVINMFKAGSPYTFGDKRQEIKRLVFDDDRAAAAMKARNTSRRDTSLWLFDLSYKSRSPLVMALALQLLITARHDVEAACRRLTRR